MAGVRHAPAPAATTCKAAATRHHHLHRRRLRHHQAHRHRAHQIRRRQSRHHRLRLRCRPLPAGASTLGPMPIERLTRRFKATDAGLLPHIWSKQRLTRLRYGVKASEGSLHVLWASGAGSRTGRDGRPVIEKVIAGQIGGVCDIERSAGLRAERRAVSDAPLARVVGHQQDHVRSHKARAPVVLFQVIGVRCRACIAAGKVQSVVAGYAEVRCESGVEVHNQLILLVYRFGINLVDRSQGWGSGAARIQPWDRSERSPVRSGKDSSRGWQSGVRRRCANR